jgi:hypothetical protein
MGIERSHTPDYFRKRAEEFRTKADTYEHGQTKEVLCAVAEHYDELARHAEKIRTVQDLHRQERHRVVQEYADDQRAIGGKLRHQMN